MGKAIEIKESGLRVRFEVNDAGVVELKDFSPEGVPDQKITQEEQVYPALEVQITGKTTRGMHGFKHNAGSASLDFIYENHTWAKGENSSELMIYMKTAYLLQTL